MTDDAARYPFLSEEANDAVALVERVIREHRATDPDFLALRIVFELAWSGWEVRPLR